MYEGLTFSVKSCSINNFDSEVFVVGPEEIDLEPYIFTENGMI